MTRAAPAAGLPSIARRLRWATVATLLGWSLLMGAVLWAAVRHEVQELMDGALQESAELLVGLVQMDGRGHALPETMPRGRERLVWQLLHDGRVVERSHQAPSKPLIDAGAPIGAGEGHDDWRVHAVPVPGHPGQVLVVGQRGKERRKELREIIGAVLAGGLGAGLLAFAWLGWRIGREMRPLERLSAAIDVYDPEHAPKALGAPSRAELAPMQHAIDALGQRLRRRMAHERAFAAHAAHALRTPLAGVVAQLATAQRMADPATRPFVDASRLAVNRLRKVVDALLTLFRSGQEPQRAEIELATLVADLPIVGLTPEVEPGTRLRADPDLLAAALLNLMDNAAKAGAKALRLRMEHEADRAGEPARRVLWLEDDGPGVDADRHARLAAALERDDYAGLDGLGLMLGDVVARAHGGRLRLGPPGPGFRVGLALSASE